MTSNIAGHIREVLLGMAYVLHDLVLKEGCELRFALGSAGRAKTSALAGERDQELLGATPATNPGEGNTRCRASSYLRPFTFGPFLSVADQESRRTSALVGHGTKDANSYLGALTGSGKESVA